MTGETVRDCAQALGLDTWEATNGLEALWIVQHHRPEIVLLDLTMPRLDGFETARHIRTLDPSIRVVVLTGDRSDETGRRVSGLGLTLLLKPPILESLQAVLRLL